MSKINENGKLVQINNMGQIHRQSTPAYLLIRRRTFKLPASYLWFESSNKDTTASGLDPTGVRLRTPSDLRCNSSASAGWRSCRFPRWVCKLAISDDPRTYERPSHSFTSSLVGFFRHIVKAAVSWRIVRSTMLSLAVVPAFNLNFFSVYVSRPWIAGWT